MYLALLEACKEIIPQIRYITFEKGKEENMQEQDVKWLIKQQEMHQKCIEMAVDRIHDHEEELKVIQDILKRIDGQPAGDCPVD